MATATTKKVKTFEGLNCPHCGTIDTLGVKLEDMTIECRDCGEEVTKAEVDAMIAKWNRLFAWLAMAGE